MSILDKPDTFTLTEEHLTLLRDEHDLPAGMTPEQWLERLEHYRRLHKETQQALQVLLHQGVVQPGNYERPRYSEQPWTLA